MKHSINILLFIILTPFLFNGQGITKMLVKKFANTTVVTLTEENEHEGCEDEVERDLYEFWLKTNYVFMDKVLPAFTFQFSYYKEVHRDFDSPPPDLT